MLPRFLSIFRALRRAGPVLALLVAAQAAVADPVRISQLLGSERLFAILQQEGVQYGTDLAQEMMGQGDDPGWRAEVAAIHAPAKLLPDYQRIFGAALATADQAAIERWLAGEPGKRMVALELAARREMLDSGVEEAAIAAARSADAAGDPKLAAIRRLIEAADLVETNVAGGLNANLAFYRAMSAGGAFPYQLSEEEMLSEVAAQEEPIREDVTAWMEGYLFMAYAPLSLEDLRACAEFSASAPGKALLQAQFIGFDAIYEHTSSELGAALARRMTAAEL